MIVNVCNNYGRLKRVVAKAATAAMVPTPLPIACASLQIGVLN